MQQTDVSTHCMCHQRENVHWKEQHVDHGRVICYEYLVFVMNEFVIVIS